MASSRHALETYGIERQRSAFQVAAHIFDLALHLPELSPLERLKYCFAAQVAFLRSELAPNALALYQREIRRTPDASALPRFSDELALHAGIALLGMRLGAVFTLARQTRDEIAGLLESRELESIFATPLGAPVGVALGAGNMATFLRNGNSQMLEQARQTLR